MNAQGLALAKLPRLLVWLVLILTTGPAVAGAYIGLGAGSADYDGNLFHVDVDDDDLGWKIFGGYRFNRFLGLEAAWLDLGEVSGRNYKVETTGFSFQGVASLPMGPVFSAFAKLGAIAWKQDNRVIGQNRDRSGTDVSWGFGGQLRLFDNRLGIRLEWERFESDLSVDLISLGASYHF